MKRKSSTAFLLLFCVLSALGQQTKTQLENEKRENLKRIAETERILSETSDKKEVTLGQLQALRQQIKARESLMRSFSAEINLLNGEIKDLSIIVDALNSDLTLLKEEYAAQIYATHKASQGNTRLMFLFSSSDFNQLLFRLKYLEQYAEARRLQADQIESVADELNIQKSVVETKRTEQQKLLNYQIRESRKLAKSRKKQAQLVAQLSKKESTLKKELTERMAANERLNRRISSLIAEEDLIDTKASAAEILSTTELTRLFESKKNTLKWPVSTGFITSKFGTQKHPVLKRITVVNDGIGIQTEKNAQVKAVFDGEVTEVMALKGKNNIVIVRHGSYRTVYARLKSIQVKKGQKLKANEPIGEVYTNTSGVSELEFHVYKGTTKLNPEHWLALK